jgi:hypothetical protein
LSDTPRISGFHRCSAEQVTRGGWTSVDPALPNGLLTSAKPRAHFAQRELEIYCKAASFCVPRLTHDAAKTAQLVGA